MTPLYLSRSRSHPTKHDARECDLHAKRRDLMKLACRELVRVFGRKYLQAHYEGTLEGHGMIDDDTFMLFVGIKTDEDLPDHPATDKGWTVHGRAHGQIAKHRLPA